MVTGNWKLKPVTGNFTGNRFTGNCVATLVRCLCWQLLAEVFLDMLTGRDDCLRSLRMLLREIVRNVKHDLNFHTFAVSLMMDPTDTKLRDLDPILKASICLSWGYN